MSDDLSDLRANQAVLAGRIAALESRLCAADDVVDAVIYCGAEKPDYGAPHPCGLPDGHEGPHSCLHAHCTVTWSDPEPVPQWRQMVGQAAGRMDAWMLPTPLGTALDILSHLEMYPRPIDDIIRLSRLVAVCEAQVGDGWQADPDEPRAHPHESQRRCDLECLLRAVGWRYEARWKPLGTRAAIMLRDLTEADA